jgi:hypothetical protein
MWGDPPEIQSDTTEQLLGKIEGANRRRTHS